MSAPLQTHVAVIGAGTYGISIGLELHRLGIPFELVGIPFELWLRHTLPGFALRSDVRASGVFDVEGRRTLLRWVCETLPRAQARRTLMRRMPGPLFRRYLRWVLARLPFAVHEAYATAIERVDDAFDLTTGQGLRIRARRVVIATGVPSHRWMPGSLRALGGECVTHSWDAQALARLADARLLVVGGGQSAGEACVLLAQRNRVTWVHKDPLRFFQEPIGIPTLAYTAARGLAGQVHRLPWRLRRTVSRRFTEPTITPELRRPLARAPIRRRCADADHLGLRRQNGAVRCDALEETYDRVVACTGYRFRLGSLGFLSEPLRQSIRTEGNAPVLDARFETSVPGLHLVGGLAEPSHGAAQRFMMGARDAAVRVGRAMEASWISR